MIWSSGAINVVWGDEFKLIDFVPVDMVAKLVITAAAVEKIRYSSFLVLQYSASL